MSGSPLPAPSEARGRRPPGRRPVLVSLIGRDAYRSCLHRRRLTRSLVLPLLFGCAAIAMAVLDRGTLQIAAIGLWSLCVVYSALAIPLIWVSVRRASRLASRKLSSELGYPIRVRSRGGSLDLDTWRDDIERAIDRHPLVSSKPDPTP
ncbi:MAG TPA: hypothetical protein VI138_07945 [Candidatus Dormibacteraeota bacterium]